MSAVDFKTAMQNEGKCFNWRVIEGKIPYSGYFCVDLGCEFNKDRMRQCYLENYVWKNLMSAEELEIFVQYFSWAGKDAKFTEYIALINSSI